MPLKKFRNLIVHLHRWLGLMAGLLLVIIGLTGSLLVFHEEISDWLNTYQFGKITPTQTILSPEKVLNLTRSAYPDWQPVNLYLPKDDRHPYKLRMTTPTANPDLYLDGYHEVFIDPYTGTILGDRLERYSFYRFLLNLHYRLFAEDIGITLIGIIGIILLILSSSGLILWPGWRKFLNGFKIKWNAHPQRLSFDIHKVVGVITFTFLMLIAFTGVCWNFYDISQAAIYTLTNTPTLPEPTSSLNESQTPLNLTTILANADLALPDAKTNTVYIPNEPDGVFMVFKKIPGGLPFGGSTVYLDRYMGKILRVNDERNAQLGDRILNSFYPLHFGSFGGIYSRFLYVLVGLAPSILLITSLSIIWHKKQRKKAIHS